MTPGEDARPVVEQAKQDLIDYAVDREEIKWLMERLDAAADIDRTAVEYELGVLKIVATGLAISFYMEDAPHKNDLVSGFWAGIDEFSVGISETSGAVAGTRIDYFGVLKKRLDEYVDAISRNPDGRARNDASVAVGPKFAEICGNVDDVYTRMTGMSMFMTNVDRVGRYLQKTGLMAPGGNGETSSSR